MMSSGMPMPNMSSSVIGYLKSKFTGMLDSSTP
jgi:hypothetical protein